MVPSCRVSAEVLVKAENLGADPLQLGAVLISLQVDDIIYPN
jgi:hypothetical protein